MEALVIIDMQHTFDASRKTTVRRNVMKLVNKFIRSRRWVIVVEYAGCGSTYDTIINKLSGYSKSIIVTKMNNDGSKEVLAACLDNKIRPDTFILCGVYTTMCVHDTAVGLSERGKNVLVRIDACSCTEPLPAAKRMLEKSRIPYTRGDNKRCSTS